jgi:hypothetical protein
MGIETPEEYGGAVARFSRRFSRSKNFSRVDASVGVFVDVQNTLVNNASFAGPRRIRKEIPDAIGERKSRRVRAE